MDPEYSLILDFWFRELKPSHWFMPGGPELDDVIRARFLSRLQAAKRGELDGWAASPRGRLALIILLDQFSRNIFRGSSEAFAADAKAQKLSLEGIEAGMDTPLTFSERQFFYMPLMHAENMSLQALSIEKFAALKDEAMGIFRFAETHRATVEQFGRFPGRNAALERASTPAEEAFLAPEPHGSAKA